ncbi:MAG: CvpA family protein [Planctomycetota bacterium]|nr:CvpA family protein [Planctomycetota bacterium]
MLGHLTDFLLLAFLLLQTWMGCRRGLLWQAAGLAALGFGMALGMTLAPALGARLIGVVTENAFHAQLIAFLFVACALGLILRLLAVWAEVKSEDGLPSKEKERRRGQDRILGGIFGALKGFVIAAVAMAACVTLWPGTPAFAEARLVPPLAQAGARLLPEGAVEDVRAWVDASGGELAKGLQIQTRETTLHRAKLEREQAP